MLAVKSTEVAVGSFAVESDFSSTSVGVSDEPHFGGAVAGDEGRQTAAADG